MHRLTSSFVLGYHGCDAKEAEARLHGEDFKPSNNDFDWLGPGVYFWEANPKRGLDYARELMDLNRGPKIDEPAVIGAVIDLGLCLDLTTSAGIQQVKESHKRYVELSEQAGVPLPKNSADFLRRYLDCAVVNTFHDIRKSAGEPAVDSVKGVFTEGHRIYPGSGFFEKTHIQICVCNLENIKGVFRVPKHFLR